MDRQGESKGRDHVTRPGQSRQLASLATGGSLRVTAFPAALAGSRPGIWRRTICAYSAQANVAIMAILPAAWRQLVLLSAGQSRPAAAAIAEARDR